jgi:hypothetical protein
LVALPGTFEANTFPVTPPISVQGGDILGLWFPNGFNNCAREITGTGGGLIGTPYGLSDPKVNEVLALPNAIFTNDVNESANLVTPSKDQCRNGGWQTFGQYNNHGDCTSFVATGGKNPPAGS